MGMQNYTPPNDGRPPSLYGKLAEIMAAIQPVEARGVAEEDGFRFVQANDLEAAVRVELAERRVAFLVAEQQSAARSAADRNGQAVQVLDVTCRFTFADADSGETYGFNMTGTAPDVNGTGRTRAMTNATKLALGKTFLVTAEADDTGPPAENPETFRWPFDGANKGNRITEVDDDALLWMVQEYRTTHERYRVVDDARRAMASAELERRRQALPATAEALDRLAGLLESAGLCDDGHAKIGEACEAPTQGWAERQIERAEALQESEPEERIVEL